MAADDEMETSAERNERMQKYGRAPSRSRKLVLRRRPSVDSAATTTGSSASASPASSSGSDGEGHRTSALYSPREGRGRGVGGHVRTHSVETHDYSSDANDMDSSPTTIETDLRQRSAARAVLGFHETGPGFKHPGAHTRKYFDSADWMLAERGMVPPVVRCRCGRDHLKGGLPSCYPVAETRDFVAEHHGQNSQQHTASCTGGSDEASDSAAVAQDAKTPSGFAGKGHASALGRRERERSLRERLYFDSADWELSHHTAAPTVHTYKGGFTQDVGEPTVVSHQLGPQGQKGRRYFDSADWNLASAGVQGGFDEGGVQLAPRVRAALVASRPNAAFAVIHEEGASGTAEREAPPARRSSLRQLRHRHKSRKRGK